ncbi:MAG: ATP-binding protein [Reichenbachiella sp.]
MRGQSRLLWLMMMLLSLQAAKGQYAFDPQVSFGSSSISQWTTEDGMVSNNLTDIYQSNSGLIWITSFNGFMIYDGERFEVYDKRNLPDILETDGMYSIMEDSDSILYLGTQGSGIVTYHNRQFSKFIPKGVALPISIPVLFFSEDYGLIIGSNNHGVFQYKNDSLIKLHIPQFDKATIKDIVEDKYGTLWIGSEGDGLIGFKNGNSRHYNKVNGMLDDYIVSLASNTYGDLFIGTSEGLQVMNNHKNMRVIEQVGDGYINSIYIDEWNTTWVGTEIGLNRLNQELDEVESIEKKRGIELIKISGLLQDREGSIWVISGKSGLIRIKESAIDNITHPTISSDKVNIVHESWDGNFYIGTNQNTVDICDIKNECTSIELKTDLRGNGVRDIYHDEDGSLWLATYVGIIHVKDDKEVVYSMDTGMPANNFRVIHKDKKGVFWFGSRSGGLVKFKNGDILDIYSKNHKLKSNFILSITEDYKGNLLIGTHSGGLSIITPVDDVKIFHLKEDDAGILIFNIEMISDTSAIAAANVGPLFFDGKSLTEINLIEDSRSKTYFDVVKDFNNNIWLTTNIGLIRINSKSWEKYQKKEVGLLPYVLLNESDGMNNKECTGATRSLLSSNGQLYIPTIGGVSRVDPSNLKSNVVKPDVIIRNVIIDEVEYLRQPGIDAPAGSMRFVFEYSVLSFISTSKNQYKYKLEGVDDDWSVATNRGNVEYTNLEPGVYTFKVIGSNDNNVWNDTGDSYKFRVTSYFYETFWFYVLIISLVVLILLLFYKWRISFINKQNIELKKVNAELDRFVYSASHELRSPLSSVLGLVNIARSDSENVAEYLNHIEKSVLRLDTFIHDIIDYSRNARLGLQLEKIHVGAMVHEILYDIEFSENFVKITHQVVDTHKAVVVSDYKRVKIVLSNIITNAFKHHHPDSIIAPFVKVNIKSTDRGVKIEIKDNGPGINRKYQKNIFKMFYRASSATEGSGLGLYIVEEIISKLNGELKLNSREGEGSKFIVILPNL